MNTVNIQNLETTPKSHHVDVIGSEDFPDFTLNGSMQGVGGLCQTPKLPQIRLNSSYLASKMRGFKGINSSFFHQFFQEFLRLWVLAYLTKTDLFSLFFSFFLRFSG